MWRQNICNKKVLLRERKRHTARRVASTWYAALVGVPPAGGYPARGELHARGYPFPGGVPPCMGRGTPCLGRGGTPLPHLGMGYPPSAGWGTPPCPDLGREYLPPKWWTKWKHYLRSSLRMRAVKTVFESVSTVEMLAQCQWDTGNRKNV